MMGRRSACSLPRVRGVNAVDRHGVTPLWLACTNRNVQNRRAAVEGRGESPGRAFGWRDRAHAGGADRSRRCGEPPVGARSGRQRHRARAGSDGAHVGGGARTSGGRAGADPTRRRHSCAVDGGILAVAVRRSERGHGRGIARRGGRCQRGGSRRHDGLGDLTNPREHGACQPSA